MHQEWNWVYADDGRAIGIKHRSYEELKLSMQEVFELRDLVQLKMGPWPMFGGPIGAECSKEMQAVIDKYQPLYDEQVRQDVERIKNGNSD